MSSLVGGTGIIGQDMIVGFGNGKYKTFEGTEIAAENCVKAKVKDLVVEGKTYQNLFDMQNLNYNYCDTFTKDGYININIPELSTGYKVCKSAVNNLIKANTVYTIIIDVRKNTFNKNFGINSDYNNEGYFSKNIAIQQNFIGRMIVTATSKETLPSNSQKVFRTQITPDSLGELEFKLMLLEGDYTKVDIPNSINGIESVTERENNILSVKINDNTTTLNLPIPLKSLPNGTCDTIEGNKLVQRVGKVVLDGTENWALRVTNDDYLVYNCSGLNILKTSTDYFNSSSRMICEQFAPSNISSMDSTAITKEGICLRGAGTGFILSISKNKLDTQNLAGFKSYLKSNPVTVTYELYSQIIHSLEIPSMSTTKGTNIITTSNNIKPKLKLKVKVKK